MHRTEQSLDTALAELRCIRAGEQATLDELTALAVAHRSIDALLHACVDELRMTPVAKYSWA